MKSRHNALGFVRVGTAVPRMKVADPAFNAARTVEMMARADAEAVDVVAFPELNLTGYTCGDLFHNRELRSGALDALFTIAAASAELRPVFIVGMPLEVDGMLFNCAAVVHRGKVLGIVPKSYLPGYKEFYEPRWFRRGKMARSNSVAIEWQAEPVPFGTDLLFCAEDMPEFIFGVEICEDVWSQIPPSILQTMAGALLCFNISASNERIGKAHYRRTQLVPAHSAANLCAYAYVSAGIDESTTDIVFSGHMLIAVNGDLTKENKRFERNAEGVLLFDDVDTEKLQYERVINNTYADCQSDYADSGMLNFRRIGFICGKTAAPQKLAFTVDAHPFVPKGETALRERCEEIDAIQVAALNKRLSGNNIERVTIGVSGGLDSTRALQVVCQSFDQLGKDRKNIIGFTMPGFGTTDRTKGNAHKLMEQTGITAREVDIRAMCFEQWRSEGYKPFGIDLNEVLHTVRRRHLDSLKGRELKPEDLDVDFTAAAVEEFQERLKDLPTGAQDLRFENTQARMRTKILMDNGFVIGTGDLSELALGWCTYNGDHMSMYNVNCSVPKTLIRFLVHWSGMNQFEGAARETLLDIFNTEISPELLPKSRKGENNQKTEKVVGPYELTDFFLYFMLRYGMGPEKILYLAKQAKFHDEYSEKELRHWLRMFLRRFFGSQFKRSCVPDGPKVGSVSLSPRGDWRMPSDASMALWMSWLDATEPSAEENATMSNSTNAPATTGGANPVVRAHVTVDAVNDFGSETHTDGGANKALLPVPEGEQVGPAIGRLQKGVKYVKGGQVAGNDTHPFDMFNFKEVAGDVPTVKDANGNDAAVFPRHCVAGTWGCEFLPGIDPKLVDRIFPKGDKPNLDSFSACGNEELIPYLKSLGVTDVDVDGLVFRICIGHTALDLANAGFRVRVITDATRDLEIPVFQPIIDAMKANANITFATVDEAIALG
jgi:NAD+ synthase (glutamine-hydrolysing)